MGPGDFDFLSGNWRIKHRKLEAPGTGSTKWDEFEGDATCRTVLDGLGSIEELRAPSRGINGLGVRLYDLEKQVWADYWVSARNGQLGLPAMLGSFVDGVGTFTSEELEGELPIKARAVWDRITATSCRWHQDASRDGGLTWEASWFMDWVRT